MFIAPIETSKLFYIYLIVALKSKKISQSINNT